MERVISRAPARVDLAGGSLDLWPVGLITGGAITVNVALSLRAEVTCTRREGPVLLASGDLDASYEWAPGADRGALPLLERFCEHFGVVKGWEIRTVSGSPPGAGLGGSSALSVALAGALGAIAGSALEDQAVVALCRDLEAVQLGIPTGVQDFWPAIRGGALSIRYEPGQDGIEPLDVNLDGLDARMVVAYSGRSRLSSGTNWEMVKRFLDGDEKTRGAMLGVAAAARAVRESLLNGDLDAMARAVAEEWSHRQRLAPGVATDETRGLEEVALKAGAVACKACGAGGGGCMVFFAAEGRKETLAKGLSAAGAQVLEAHPTRLGRVVEVIP